MSESATPGTERRRSGLSRREATTAAISREAVRLTLEHGFDGFTMEQLADAGGVSRRTLFNHFASKVDAVLGPEIAVDDEHLATFRAGGPHGDLVRDLLELAVVLVGSEVEIDPAGARRLRDAMDTDPRLIAAAQRRFAGYVERFLGEARLREGEAYDAHRADIAIRALLGLFDAAMDRWIHDAPERPLHAYLVDAVVIAYDLFGGTPPPPVD